MELPIALSRDAVRSPRRHRPKTPRRRRPASTKGVDPIQREQGNFGGLLLGMNQVLALLPQVFQDDKFWLPNSAKPGDVVVDELNKQLLKLYNIALGLMKLKEDCLKVTGEKKVFYDYAANELNREVGRFRTVASRVRKYLIDINATPVNEPAVLKRPPTV